MGSGAFKLRYSRQGLIMLKDKYPANLYIKEINAYIYIGSFKSKEEVRRKKLEVLKEWCGPNYRQYESHSCRNLKCYNVWNSMRTRCYNKKDKGYKNYGGRGIRVCKSWKNSFKSFYSDMGDCPAGLSLDRIDNNKDYCKENCKWSTRSEQMRNRRSYRKCKKGAYFRGNTFMSRIRIDGKTVTIGNFKTEDEAHDAFCVVFREWYGHDPIK